MLYREVAPHPCLAPFVRTCWTLSGAGGGIGPQPVLPDGCTELIVHRGRPFWRHDAEGGATRQATHLFVGQMLAPVVIAPDGDMDIVAIRFEPYGAFALIGGHQARPADQILDASGLGEAWLGRAIRSAEAADTAENALQILERALVARLDDRISTRVDRRVASAAQAMIRANGRLTIDDAARRAGTSPRHLERLFHEQIGTSPKRFARVLRFQAAAAEIAANPTRTLADISTGSGYFDQAHMIREFVTLARTTPGRFQKSMGELTRFLLA